MKHKILILFFLAFAFSLSGQTPLYTTGITFCNGVPAHNPGNNGAKYAIDTSTWDLYVRSYGTTWSKAGDWLQFRTGTGTPAAPPTKFESVFAINAADSLYYYDGATWKHLNPASTGGVTGSGLTNRLAYWTAAGALGYESSLTVDSVNNTLIVGGNASANGPISGIRPKLEVKDGVNRICYTPQYSFGPIVEITNGTVTSLGPFIGNSSSIFGSFSNHPTVIRSNNVDMVTVRNSGSNDALGLSAPNTKFIGNSSTIFGTYSEVGGVSACFAVTDGTRRGLLITSTSEGIVLGSYSNHNVVFRTNNVVRSTITTAGDMAIGGTFSPSARLDVRGSGTTPAASALDVANSNDSTILLVRNDRRVGINTTTPDLGFQVEGTDGIGYPSGTTAQRTAVNNQIRNNTDVEGLEIRENGVWFRLTSSQAPSIAAGAAAGTGPTVAIGAGSNDLGGTIEITTGTSTTTGTLATITYGDAFDAALSPSVTITPANAKAAEHMLQWHKGTSGNSSFVLTSRVALDASTLYVFTYQVQQ